jgi:hypothetical protein
MSPPCGYRDYGTDIANSITRSDRLLSVFESNRKLQSETKKGKAQIDFKKLD